MSVNGVGVMVPIKRKEEVREKEVRKSIDCT